MPKFAANLSMMFTEVPFLDRFAAAAAQGFNAVEFLFRRPSISAAVSIRRRERPTPPSWRIGRSAMPGKRLPR